MIREARLRAGLTQQELAERSGRKRGVIARWEQGAVAPSARDADRARPRVRVRPPARARPVRARRRRPTEERTPDPGTARPAAPEGPGRSRRLRVTQQRFDPYATLEALEGRGVAYVLIGAFARVVQGTEEITRGLDLAPSLHGDNLRRLALALDDLGAARVDGEPHRARRGDDPRRAGDRTPNPRRRGQDRPRARRHSRRLRRPPPSRKPRATRPRPPTTRRIDRRPRPHGRRPRPRAGHDPSPPAPHPRRPRPTAASEGSSAEDAHGVQQVKNDGSETQMHHRVQKRPSFMYGVRMTKRRRRSRIAKTPPVSPPVSWLGPRSVWSLARRRSLSDSPTPAARRPRRSASAARPSSGASCPTSRRSRCPGAPG